MIQKYESPRVRGREDFVLASKLHLQLICVMDLVEAINSKLPEGRRPITSLSRPGEINRQIAEVLADTVSSAEVGETIKSLLTADKRTKEGGSEPDWRAREAGAKLWLAYQVGLPVQRQEIHQTVVNKSEEENMRTLQSPAMLAAMKNLIARVEGADNGKP
jgi:hypothetical protein